MKIVTSSFLKYLPRRPGLTFLQTTGIACGVAAVMGMSLSAGAALESFRQAVDFIRGEATHSLERPAGPLDERVLSRLMLDESVESFSPVIDRRIRLRDKLQVRIMGIDPLLDGDIRPELTSNAFSTGRTSATGEDLTFLLGERIVLMENSLVEEMGLDPGDMVETSRGLLKILGTFPNPSGEPLLAMDIAAVQELLSLDGVVDRVDLILTDEDAFLSRWDEGYTIQTFSQRRETLGAMLRAFRLNLEALSLFAALVGVFLIYNTAMFTVISRKRDVGILRSLGASRVEVAGAFTVEILLLGILGGALGGLAGFLLSRMLTGVIGGTISNLYFFLRPTPPALSPWMIAGGALLGCLASLMGAAYPLKELLRIDPVTALQGRTYQRSSGFKAFQLGLAGFLIISLSTVCLGIGDHIYIGFAGAFGCLLGLSLASGVFIVATEPIMKRIFYILTGLPGKLAAGFIRQNLSRTGIAVAAFMIALSMSIGLGSLIGSFRHSLVWWMGTQLTGDLYIGNVQETNVPLDFYEELKTMPGIGGLDPYRNSPILYKGSPVSLISVDAVVLQKYTDFGWLKGGDENWEPVKDGAVIVSESFSRRFGIGAGDSLTLEGVDGERELTVSAVFYDYTSEHGLIMMDRSTYLDLYQDSTLSSLAIFIDPENPRRERIISDIKRMADRRGLPVTDREKFYGGILSVFDSTFAVTRSMRILAIVIALLGIAGALLIMFIERQREFGIYRALGFSTRQVAAMTLMEGLGLGLISFFISIAGGTTMGFILIKVINLRSFNWTIFFHPSIQPYLMAAVTAVTASLAASLYPVWRIYRTYPQMQLREE